MKPPMILEVLLECGSDRTREVFVRRFKRSRQRVIVASLNLKFEYYSRDTVKKMLIERGWWSIPIDPQLIQPIRGSKSGGS